jgi:hypothetical protein
LSGWKIRIYEGIFMDKVRRVICVLGSLAVVSFGIYKGLANKEHPKYSLKWITKLTDREWEAEREIIRQKFCNPKYDDSTRIGFQNLLRLFDKVKSNRDWAGIKPQGAAYHESLGLAPRGLPLFKGAKSERGPGRRPGRVQEAEPLRSSRINHCWKSMALLQGLASRPDSRADKRKKLEGQIAQKQRGPGIPESLE